MEFKHLFEPIKIGPVEIRNRIYMSPANVHFAEPDGTPGDRSLCYYAARAKGGCGLIVHGCVLASKRAADQQDMVLDNLYQMSQMSAYYDFTEAIHHFGAKVFIQLSPGFGRQQRSGRQPCWSASAIEADPKLILENPPKPMEGMYLGPSRRRGATTIPREMTIEEIKQDVEDFAYSAELAVCSGYDGIEIHACHGYLLHQFLSPRTNKRTDMYGGSLENRTRFLVEIIQALKKQFGDAVPIMPRISANEHLDDGLTPEDMRDIMVIAEKAGADAIELSDSAGHESWRWWSPEADIVDTHLLEEQGKKLKARVKVPVLTPYFHNYEIAEKAIANGETDMIGSLRQFIADPEFPNKLKAGRPQDIVKCNFCFFCYISILSEGGCRCTVNPNMGRERFMPEYWPAATISKIPESLRRWRVGTDEMKKRVIG